jgi:hypothetical protein
MDCPGPVAISEESMLVTYSTDGDERMTTAVINAFTAGNVDVNQRSKSLQDQIDTDSIAGFDWGSERALSLATTLWGHHVVLTPSAVRIYENG